MKPRKNRTLLITLIVTLIVWMAMIAILYLVESRNDAATIRNLGDAIWYAVVTLTSVGYGDVTPVTHIGRVIGFIFVLSSVGILLALFGAAVSFLTSEGVPRLRLSFLRKRNWYYFSGFSEESDALAQDVLRNDDDAVIIFGVAKEKGMELPDYQCIFLNSSPLKVVKLKSGKGSRCKMFYVQEEDFSSNLSSVVFNKLDADIYVRSYRGPATEYDNIRFFHAYDCCARDYWKKYPLLNDEKDVVIIGFENYGKAILERAILTNIISESGRVRYHVFGDASEFLMIHDRLRDVMNINENSGDEDSIIFHDGQWEACRELIADASRVILCDDDEDKVWEDYWRMDQFYEIGGRVDIRSNTPRVGFSVFGTYEDMFTVQQIVRAKLNYTAYALNELYMQGHPENSVRWEQLSDSLQASKIATADHLNAKVRIILGREAMTEVTAEDMEEADRLYHQQVRDPDILENYRKIEHRRWRRYYAYNNWAWADKFDAKKRLHPMMVPYEELSEKQKESHDKAWELIGFVAPKLKEYE